MTSRRTTIALLLVGGAGVLLVCALQWVSATVDVLSGVSTRTFTATGSEVVPQASPLAVVVIAGALAVLAVRGWVRQALGVLLALIGLLLAVAIVGFGINRRVDAGAETLIDLQVRPWWVLAAVFALIVIVSGIVCAVSSRRWPSMGSRYERQGTSRAQSRSPWEVLDAGDDPTAAPDPDPGPAPA
ncbi:MAG: Trp biosynthesis-associated membrane protein [Candidatus Nanopelagicales bacterium]|nr:Trp biosynthesis-associated membrane protein [Candidatus Nanopelagicales bacterium]